MINACGILDNLIFTYSGLPRRVLRLKYSMSNHTYLAPALDNTLLIIKRTLYDALPIFRACHYRTRITVWGTNVCYPGDVGTNTASLELFKLMINSILSREGAKDVFFDIELFYLSTPLGRPEYVLLHSTHFSHRLLG